MNRVVKNRLEYVLGNSLLQFYGDQLNSRPDFLIKTNCSPDKVEVLIFFDSRGISSDYNGSVAERIVQKLENKKERYLLVSRPLEITTWMTLYNFVRLNNIKPIKIITNMGFVDFTPKKIEVIEKSTIQYNCFFSNAEADVHFVERYPGLNGQDLELFMQHYPETFKDSLVTLFENTTLLVFNTPILASNYYYERARPASFFQGVKEGNEFNDTLRGNVNVFNFKEFSNDETYDAVHYTSKGMKQLYSSIEPFL